MKDLVYLLKDEEGASMAEYALLLGLITVAITSIITVLGGRISSVFNRASTTLN